MTRRASIAALYACWSEAVKARIDAGGSAEDVSTIPSVCYQVDQPMKQLGVMPGGCEKRPTTACFDFCAQGAELCDTGSISIDSPLIWAETDPALCRAHCDGLLAYNPFTHHDMACMTAGLVDDCGQIPGSSLSLIHI